jgi:NitT/TauT family transport system substrate-binding protein
MFGFKSAKGSTGFLYVAIIAALFSCGCRDRAGDSTAVPTLRIGHVGHDHHLALYTALDNADEYAELTGLTVQKVRDRDLYKLYDSERHVANLEIVQVGGGAKMPTSLAQGVIDVGLGGVAPILAACDRGAPVQLIAPLHSKGDMLVVRPELAIDGWQGFVAYIENANVPVRIGYKSPMAVAKILLEDSLTHEGITFSGDPSNRGAQVHLINLKGGGKLNMSLSGELVDAYVGNNPFPAIAEDMGIGRIVCDLEELPPGRFRNHPCCCVAANMRSLEGKEEAVEGLLVLLLLATETINADLNVGVECACRWLGTTADVEKASIPTSGYSLEASDEWHECMSVWFDAMNNLDTFEGKLQGLQESEAAVVAYDLSYLQQAEERLDAARTQ